MSFTTYHAENLFSVQGKVAVITGGATGIGKALATALAMNGAKVVICGRRLEVTEAAAAELSKAAKTRGGSVIGIQADVSTKQGVVDFVEKCSTHTDKVDLLVNNAGYSSNWKDTNSLGNTDTLEQKLWSIDDADWANMTAIHVAGPYYLAVRFIPFFKRAASPVVVNITSMASLFLNRAVCEYSYAQSKAAEAHMTRLMAAALGPLGIRVNAIIPGLFPSQLTTVNGALHSVMAQYEADMGGRCGKLEEIAGPLLMLASPAGAFMNGADVLIDCGWLMNASAKDV